MDTLYIHCAPVRFTHTDPAGYVFFPRYFEMFQAAVEDWFTHCLGVNYAEQILTHAPTRCLQATQASMRAHSMR